MIGWGYHTPFPTGDQWGNSSVPINYESIAVFPIAFSSNNYVLMGSASLDNAHVAAISSIGVKWAKRTREQGVFTTYGATYPSVFWIAAGK